MSRISASNARFSTLADSKLDSTERPTDDLSAMVGEFIIVVGTAEDDFLYSAGPSGAGETALMLGGRGDDNFRPSEGGVFFGGTGRDIFYLETDDPIALIYGGAGRDTFVFENDGPSDPDEVAVIMDYQIGEEIRITQDVGYLGDGDPVVTQIEAAYNVSTGQTEIYVSGPNLDSYIAVALQGQFQADEFNIQINNSVLI